MNWLIKIGAMMALLALAACGPGATVSKTAYVFGGAAKGGVDQVTACTRGGIEGKSCAMYLRNDQGKVLLMDKVTGDTVGGRMAMAVAPVATGAVINGAFGLAMHAQAKNCGSGGCSSGGQTVVNVQARADSDSTATSTTTGGGACQPGRPCNGTKGW